VIYVWGACAEKGKEKKLRGRGGRNDYPVVGVWRERFWMVFLICEKGGWRKSFFRETQ
jgi:hypothetical protein